LWQCRGPRSGCENVTDLCPNYQQDVITLNTYQNITFNCSIHDGQNVTLVDQFLSTRPVHVQMTAHHHVTQDGKLLQNQAA